MALEIRHVEINASSSASKSFNLRDSLLGPPFLCHATQTLEIQMCSITTVELKRCETSSFYRIFYLMQLKAQKGKVIFNFGI